MTVLAIDTSSRRRVVVVTARVDGVLEHSDVREGSSVGTALPLAVEAVPLAQVTAVVVAIGPGSFTGLRAGMAAALGLAQARELPLHGVATLDVVAAGWRPGDGDEATVAIEAGRGFWYAARCVRVGIDWDTGVPARLSVDELRMSPQPVASPDAVPLLTAVRVDPALALAAVVPSALATAPLPWSGVSAVYVQ